MISILHPSRGRPEKSYDTIREWLDLSSFDLTPIEVIISIDCDDPIKSMYYERYHESGIIRIIENENRSAVDAINNAAKVAYGNLLMVVSDDTQPFTGWNYHVLKAVDGKQDFILKTEDGIQPWIITNPILDRAYYNRTGYIYDPDFRHMFCDTWLTVQADISGRKLTSNLMFRHLNDTIKDDVRKRSDATWDEGQRTFIQKLKQTPVEDLRKITDQSMKNWIRNYAGIRL